MANPRGGFSATLLPDGMVLVAGGLGGFGFPAPAADELYDPATGSWVATGRMAYPRATFSATLLANGKVLVLGGSSYGELYDPGTGSWTLTGGIHRLPGGHTVTLLIDGQVLVAGGIRSLPNGNNGSLASAELYDPVSGTWTPTGSMLTRRANATATLLLDGKVLVVGGDDFGSGTLASAEVYDPHTGTWVATGSMHEVRADHTATRLLDGRVLVGGGVSNEPDTGIASASAELYDPGSGSWSVTGRMTAARMYATATLLSDGRVFVVGGLGYYGDGAALASAEVYDAATGSWSSTGSMHDLVGYTATLLPDGKVLVLGGGSDNVAELYNPGNP